MKKLYERIEDINIKGGVELLSEVVTVMDIALQNIAAYTDKLVKHLVKFNATNMGKRYENVVSNSLRLRDDLFDASYQLNDMQNQIVAYQNKIYRYEGMTELAEKRNPYLVTKADVTVTNSGIQFNKTDMIELVTLLRSYSEGVLNQLRTIKEKKEEIAEVWQDSQYKDFAEFVDRVIRKVFGTIKIFEDFVLELEARIKGLD